MHTSTPRLAVILTLIAFTASAAEVRQPSEQPTQVPLVLGGLSLGVAAVSGAFVLGNALQHAGGCAAGAALSPLFGGGGGCDGFAAGPLGLVSISALAFASAMFIVQYVVSKAPPVKQVKHATLFDRTDSDGRRATVPQPTRPAARTDVGFDFEF